MKRTDKFVAAFDAIDASDPERAHGISDALLLAFVPVEIQEAHVRLTSRCDWWVCA